MGLEDWFKRLFGIKPKLVLIENKEKPLWYKIASAELGVRELNPGDNKRILEYHAATSLKASTDEIYWCASFVCWALEGAGVESTKSAWARSYASWGVELDIPRVGCICVFERGRGGHVGFFVAYDYDGIWVLGGNQSNAVSVAKYKKENLISFRWPKV